MCLMFGPGMGQSMEPMFPPTPEASKHRGYLQIVAVLQLLISLGLIISSGGVFGMSSICTCICLFCATMNYNYCCLLIYIIYTLFDFLQNVDPIGLYLQNTI